MPKGVYEHKRGYNRPPFSREWIKKLSLAHKGKTGWNKGLSSWSKGKKFSEEHKLRISLALTGKNNHFWKGGKSSIIQKLRTSAKYRNWRTAVFERDNYTCQECKQRGYILNADHIKPFSRYPELRFDINNGRTLCLKCHQQTSTFGLRLNQNYVSISQ